MLFTDSKSKYVTIFFLLAQMFHHYFLPMLSIFNVLGFFQLTVFYFIGALPCSVPKLSKRKILKKEKNI